MPEKIDDRTIFSLSEVAGSIRKTISERYTTSFWVKAEMNRLQHYPQSGHCYPELVEKAAGRIVAEMRSNLWKEDYLRINARFLEVLHEPLRDGISVLLFARVTYSPVYGLSLWIQDIDPSYSLGELEKEKRETIARLRREGIHDANRKLQLPLLPKRIAVISVQTSKGYADFLQVIEGNPWGYGFFQMLFPSVLQGENAVESIIGQLRRIRRVMRHFDAVALIRGGGGEVGLSCYNHYELAREVALFPLPVLTGIGHSTNETVAEMVSFRNAITPTDLADFLIQKFHNFSVPVQKARETVIDRSRTRLREERLVLKNAVQYLKKDTLFMVSQSGWRLNQAARALDDRSRRLLTGEANRVEVSRNGLVTGNAGYFRDERSRITSLEKQVSLMDPAGVLKRGYSITLLGGKALNSVRGISEGDRLTTVLADGEITSVADKPAKPEHP